MKVCKGCKRQKPLSDYYKHKGMADGHLHRCKDCVKKRIKKHRLFNVDRIREYDRKRGARQSENYRKGWRAKYTNKYNAQTIVGNAIRDKKLFKEPCEICGEKKRVHAHHDDYLKPLNVRWLCPMHHKQWHVENGEGKNGAA